MVEDYFLNYGVGIFSFFFAPFLIFYWFYHDLVRIGFEYVVVGTGELYWGGGRISLPSGSKER